MTPQARSTVVAATLDYLRTAHGDDVAQSVLEAMPADARDAVNRATATDEVDLVHVFQLWRTADQALRVTHPDWMESAGAHSITSKGVQLYGGIVRKQTPLAFLTQPVSLFRLFYHSGGMEVVEREDGRAVLRLLDFEPDVDALFCRRQTGGLRRSLELAGGADAKARHVRCVTDGDAFCEWELTWTGPAGA